MANGANRLFDVIKQTGESTNGIASQVVSLTIKSVNPLILMRDDRLEIPAEFCILHKSLDINNFRINDIVTAIVLNNGQQYFILYNDTAEEQRINYSDLDNKPKINGIELNGNKTSDDLLIVSKSELQQIIQDMTTNINNKVNKSGDTMTGALVVKRTSFNYNGGAIPGAKLAQATTIEDLINELRYTNGQMGSFELKTAYTLNNKTIAKGWYCYLYIPHRFGGLDGNDYNDNTNFGILILTGMTFLNSPMYIVQYNNKQIRQLQSFLPS